MLTDFDNTIKQVLVQRVPLDPNEVDVSFDCPKREWSAKVLKPTVNLYLYDVRENMDFKRTGWTVERGLNGASGVRRPPVYVDLSYFITAWARNIVDEHHLLWRVMATLMREAEIGSELLQGMLKEVGPPVKTVTAQADGILRNPGEFWSALDNDLKPAVTYTATLVLDLDVLLEAPLVLTKVVEIGPKRHPEQQRVETGPIGPTWHPEQQRIVEIDGREPLARQRIVEIGGTVRARAARKGGTPEQPVAGAQVTLPQLGISVRSDDKGRYKIANIPEGTHRVRVVMADGAASEGEIQVYASRFGASTGTAQERSSSYDLEV